MFMFPSLLVFASSATPILSDYWLHTCCSSAWLWGMSFDKMSAEGRTIIHCTSLSQGSTLFYKNKVKNWYNVPNNPKVLHQQPHKNNKKKKKKKFHTGFRKILSCLKLVVLIIKRISWISLTADATLWGKRFYVLDSFSSGGWSASQEVGSHLILPIISTWTHSRRNHAVSVLLDGFLASVSGESRAR